MESRGILCAALLTVLFISACSAVPVPKQSQCSPKCDESRNLLNYLKGKKYIYEFKNLIIAHIPKGTREKVQLSISATARFHIVDKCEITLTVKNAKMTESVLKNGKVKSTKSLTELPKLLEKYPLPFGFNDGRITRICNTDKEDRTGLNVKISMISQFQISMEEIVTPTSLTERDISGDCLTEYQFDKEEGDVVHITKLKNILGCANRKMSYSDLQGQDFAKPTESSQMPLGKGHQKCSLQVSRKGHLVSSSCIEQQVFRPFSGKESGSTFDVTQTLKLLRIENDPEKHKVFDNYGPLLMTHNPTGYRMFQVSEEDSAEDILNAMCEKIKGNKAESSKTTVNEFPRLVRSLRFLDTAPDLNKLIGNIGKTTCKGMGEIGMRIYLDALPMVRNPASAIVMLDGLKSGKYSPYRRSWLFSLATIRDPSLEIIKKLAEVGVGLDSPLTVSSIVNTYCKNDELCFEEAAVMKIVKQMTDQLQGDCSSKNEQILLALRAIGNLGAASDWNVINACLNNRNIPMGFRISAAQAIRHVRCDHSAWKTVQLLTTFLKKDEDPELRINAYLSLMACPHRADILRTIIGQLDEEECQQVGSFVWSHMSNYLETSQVFRQSLKEKLRAMNFNPRKYARRFNLDMRRYSKNFEKSYYNEALNSGASLESNIIYAYDSFVPRSASLNLTGGLFGKSISLVEIGARATNLDRFIQKGMSADFPPLMKPGSRMIHFDVSKLKNPKAPSEEPSLDLYLRLFGNELIYKPNIKPRMLAAAASQMSMSSFIQMMNKNPISFSHTRLVMEAIISIPTISGLPIELSLDVAAAMDLASEVKISGTRNSMTLNTDFKPIAGLGVVGRMRMDALSTEIGVEFHGTAFTNTNFGGELTVSPSEVTLMLNAPQEKQTIIDVKSRMILISDRKRREQPDMLTDGKIVKEFCFGKRMEKALGLKICSKSQYASNTANTDGPSFPFTGTNELVITAVPVSDIKRYKMRGKYVPSRMSLLGVKSFEIELNTESAVDGQYLMALNDKSKGNKVDLSLKLRSPKRSIVVTANGDYKKREMDAKLTVDDKELAKLTSRYTDGERAETNVDIDIGGKKKYMTATLSSLNNLPDNEYDHSFKLQTMASFKSLSLIAVRKGTDKGNMKYQYSGGAEIGKRSAEFSFNNEAKYKPDSIMITKSDGDMALTFKKEDAIKFQYKNNWKMETVTDKEINDGENIVTEHTIKFDQTLLPAKYSRLNVKDGSLLVQHDLRFEPEDEFRRLLNVELKANAVDLKTSLKFSTTRMPLLIEIESALKTKTLDLKNALEVSYNGWRHIRVDDKFESKGAKYQIKFENTVSTEPARVKIIQALKFNSPAVLYHIQSNLKNDDESATAYKHNGLIAWAKDKSYSSESKIDFGTKSSECSGIYEISTKAYTNKQLVGQGFISACPDIKMKKISFEMEVQDAKETILFQFSQDGTFRTHPRNFHIGGSTVLNVPGKVDFELSINEIFVTTRKTAELSSNAELIFRAKDKSERSYGYKLIIDATDPGRRDKAMNGKAKLNVMYHTGAIQAKSTYKAEIDIKPIGGDQYYHLKASPVQKYRIEQVYSMNSVLLGSVKTELETDLTIGKSSFEFNSKHKIEGTLELDNIYDIKGEQTVDGKIIADQEVTLKETNELTVKSDQKKKADKYEHKTDLTCKYELSRNFYEIESTFTSNYKLSKVTYKISGGRQGTSSFSGRESLEWTYDGKDRNLKTSWNGGNEKNEIAAAWTVTTSFKQLKKFGAELKVDTKANTGTLSGNYNGKSVKLEAKVIKSKTTAATINDTPDTKLVVTVDPSSNIAAFKTSKLVLKTFHRTAGQKYFDLAFNVDYRKGKPSSKVKFSGGYGYGAYGFAFRGKFPNLPKGKQINAVFMFSTIGPFRALKASKPAAYVATVELLVPKVNILMKSTASKTKSGGLKVDVATHVIVNNVVYVSKGSSLVVEYKKAITSLKNKGSLTVTKGGASSPTLKETFEYNLRLKDFKMKFQSDLSAKGKDRRISLDAQSIFELRKKKKIQFEIIPDMKNSNKKLSCLFRHDGDPVWNFDLKCTAALPVFKSSSEAYLRFFSSPVAKKTTKSDLLPKAFVAFDFKIKSTTKALKDFKVQFALGTDMKGKAKFLVDSSYAKKSVDASIDISKLPSFSVDATMDGKTVNVKFTKSGKGGSLVAKVGGKKIGSADIKYEKGKLLRVDISVKPPKRKRMEFFFKQKHSKASWSWRDWSHESSLSLWTKKNKNIKFNQKIDFKFEKLVLSVDVKAKSSIKAIENLKAKLKVDAGKKKPSSYLDLTFQTNGNKLMIKHNVPNWIEYYKSSMTKINVMKGGRPYMKYEEVFNSKKILLNIEMSNAPMLSLFKVAHTYKSGESELRWTSIKGKVVVKTNVPYQLFSYSTARGPPPKTQTYITGQVPKFGKFHAKFNMLGKDNYQIKLALGNRFLNINPKVVIRSLRNPFDINIKMKIASHMPRFSSCDIRFTQFTSGDFKKSKHESAVELNGRKMYDGAAAYEITSTNLNANLLIKYKKYQYKVKADYDRSTRKYSHVVDYRIRGRRLPIFSSTADCEPYSIYKPNAKCVLTSVFSRAKQVLALVNTQKGKKTSKSIKIAWNDFRKQAIQFVAVRDESAAPKVVTSLRLFTPLRNFEIKFDKNWNIITLKSLKQMGVLSLLSLRTIKANGDIVGHLTLEIARSKDESKPKETTTIRVTSSLLKKEIKTVAVVEEAETTKALITYVKANMYFGTDVSQLSFDFKKESQYLGKNDLTLKLIGGGRYLNLYARYDLQNPVMTMSIGAEAKDWKRSLDIVFEKGKRLETTVDNGASKQTIKMSSERMAQDNGYRNILEIDYPEVNGYLKVISQISRYPLSLLVIVHSEKNVPENKLVINGRFMNSRNILLEIKRFRKASTQGVITDAYTQITLDDQNVITKLKWRPGLIDSIKKNILKELRPKKLTQYLKNRGLGLREVAKRVYSKIVAPIQSNVDLRKAEALGLAIASDVDKIQAGVAKIARMVSKAYNQNSIIKGGLTMLSEGYKMIKGAVVSLAQPNKVFSFLNKAKMDTLIQNRYKVLYAQLGEYLKQWNEQRLVSFLTRVKEGLTKANKRFNRLLEIATKQMKASVAKRNEFLKNLEKSITERVGSVFNIIMSRPESASFVMAMEKLGQNLEKIGARLLPESVLNKLIDRESIEEMKSTTRKISEILSWSSNYYKTKKQISDGRKALQLLSEGDLKKAYEVYFKPELTGIQKWDPKQGSINWQVHLPYDIKSLQSVPMAIYAYTQSRVRSIAKDVQQGTFQLGKLYLRINDEVLRYTPDELWRRQLPPYAAFAYIAGSQHFVTFDGVNIEHGGDCTYLLAHDFVDNSFSVLAQYKKMGKMVKRKYLIVQTPSAALYICSKGSVKVKTSSGGASSYLSPPLKVNDLTVTRWKNRLTITGPRGLSIVCNLVFDFCRIGMSKWSHAKINGFLGSNDYERGNDLYGTMPSAASYLPHAQYWSTGSCAKKNFAVQVDKDARAYRLCSSRFVRQRQSFGRCFSRVPPEGYMQACMNMYKMKKMAGACTIFKMYASKCKALGVQNLRAPASCTTCGKRSRLYWGAFRRPRFPHSKDRHFIFIVEEKPCTAQFKGKLDTILNYLSRRNKRDTFEMIGFGGQGHRRGVSNRVLKGTNIRGNNDAIRDTLKKMSFNGNKDVSDGQLAMQAVSMSLLLNDDPNKNTIVIMVSCSKCQNSLKYRFANVDMLMRRRGIRFHYVTPHTFGSYGGKKIIGINDYKYIGERGKPVAARGRITSVSLLKDSCSALSRSTGGSVWSMEGVQNEPVVGLYKLKDVLRNVPKQRRRCSCAGNNNIRCRRV